MLWRHPDVQKLWALYILFVTRDLGLAPALAASAAGTTVAFLWILASPVRARRTIPKMA